MSAKKMAIAKNAKRKAAAAKAKPAKKAPPAKKAAKSKAKPAAKKSKPARVKPAPKPVKASAKKIVAKKSLKKAAPAKKASKRKPAPTVRKAVLKKARPVKKALPKKAKAPALKKAALKKAKPAPAPKRQSSKKVAPQKKSAAKTPARKPSPAKPKAAPAPVPAQSGSLIRGKVFVLGDNIDTDQIIPAQYLNLVPTIPEEYERLGSLALCGLPDSIQPRYVSSPSSKTEYPIIIGAKNFGCGSSREHAPVSLGAAGCEAVVANSFARIFFRNCIATGEIYPVEADAALSEAFKTGDVAELDVEGCSIRNLRTGQICKLKPLGDAKDVIDAGGLFDYARKTGMI